MTRSEARLYLRGLEPESIGIAPVPARSRKVRFDRVEIDAVLNQLSSITIESPVNGSVRRGAQDEPSVLDEMLRGNG